MSKCPRTACRSWKLHLETAESPSKKKSIARAGMPGAARLLPAVHSAVIDMSANLLCARRLASIVDDMLELRAPLFFRRGEIGAPVHVARRQAEAKISCHIVVTI